MSCRQVSRRNKVLVGKKMKHVKCRPRCPSVPLTGHGVLSGCQDGRHWKTSPRTIQSAQHGSVKRQLSRLFDNDQIPQVNEGQGWRICRFQNNVCFEFTMHARPRLKYGWVTIGPEESAICGRCVAAPTGTNMDN